MSDARRPCHSASNPSPARSPRTRPRARRLGACRTPELSSAHRGHCPISLSASDSAHPLSSPLTFSMTTTLGLSEAIAVLKSAHSPERVPGRMPARRPARLRSWQGNPPQRMSTGSTVAQSTVVTSPKFGTPGHLAASTFDGSASNSQCHTVSAPKNDSTARSRPPTPENNEPTFKAFTARPRVRLSPCVR